MTPRAAAAQQSRILVVDDELGPRESLRMLLKPVYEVRTAQSGRAALDEIPGFRPDLMILDIKMAEMDGLEVLSRVKQMDPAIEVVMITAYASLETVKLALTRGAFEYLIKPFSRQELEDVVRRALLRRQADLSREGQAAKLVDEMRALAAKTRDLEETARREAAEQSLRVTQLSVLREISRGLVTRLEPAELTAAITEQLQAALGYDAVAVVLDARLPSRATERDVTTLAIRDANGVLGYLVVDNRVSHRVIDPRELELLEMLAEYLAIALRNSRLYGEIAETKRSLEQIIAGAGEAIIALDAHDRVLSWNPAAERIFGLPGADAVGMRIDGLLPRGDYDDAKSRLAAGTATHAFETRPATPQSHARSLAVTVSALHGRHGGLDGLIAIVRDTTREREVEKQLQQTEKLRALGTLAGGIAHDFNNLLQAILGYSQLMKGSLANTELLERSLGIVETAAIDGAETVRRIQQFARLRPDEPFVRLELSQIVQDALAITKPRWEERASRDNRALDLRLDLKPVPPIYGRPAALTELLTNLILNALDAMPEGGRVAIATSPGDGRTVVLTVSDSGVGMSEDVQRRIFEPFFSTKGEAGSGLGLAMAYSIVRRHGGDIGVDSAPGRGATFRITLPVVDHAPAARSTSAAPGEPRVARVLVVDDDPQVLAILGEMLRGVGHGVTTAISGVTALATYAPGRYDVVISNVGMAEMNGWELARRLRLVDRAVPIMFLTGWGLREDDRARLDALNVRACLFKPIGPTELDAAIQAALR
ncbi:MAG: response regulator [Candidatus Rokubacteria bacterium]|nr:response regulator [Candidatus Rokubacteria bacterium]